jgi:aminoglycoside phosphotransferase (APT) family kinase protein
MDWSGRNVHVQDGKVVAVYDWDSVALAAESTAIGQAAVTWSVTSEPGGNDFPNIGQIAAFV